jgi:acyl-CoA reductase-like NAD-dependent aldehyde dehydrogenase
MPKRKVQPVEQPTPAIGHNSELSDDALIAENHKIDELMKAAQTKFDEWAKPHTTRRDEIENTLLARLQERKVEAIRAFMENNEGKAPPGLEIGYATNLNINRS